MSNTLYEAITAWGSKLWSKDKYLELKPKNKTKDEWNNYVNEIIDRINILKKNGKPYSEKVAQAKLFKFFNE